MIKGYWKSHGKIPDGKEENRILLSEPPKDQDYVAVYQDDVIIRYDIDDYDHKTGKLVDAVKGKPRSEAVLKYLDDHDYQYVAIRTEHGVHIVMNRPDWFKIGSNRLNWYCALGIKIEAHVTKVFEPLRVNGVDRQFIKGNLTDSVVDPSAPALIPMQKGKEKPFLMEFQQGDRNNHFSEYAFHLSRSGFQTDDIKEVIQAVNHYVLEEPLPDSEIETILRPETMEKLQDIEEQTKNGSASPEVFKKFLKSLGISIRYNELLNIVEYENIPNTADYQDITDIQNVMPIKLMYEFRKYTRKQNITKHQVIDLILLEADTHTYNPVKQFL